MNGLVKVEKCYDMKINVSEEIFTLIFCKDFFALG